MLKKLACLVAILGMVSVATAATDWTGAGDGWSFQGNGNWDDPSPAPAGDSWRIYYKYYAPYAMSDVDITCTTNVVTRGGQIVNKGHFAKLTIANGASITMGSSVNPDGISFNSPGALIVKTGGLLDQRYGQLTIDNPNTTTTIEAGGDMLVSTLRHDNGTKLHVYGDLWIYTISRIAIDPGWLFNVYDGGKVTVAGPVPTTVWSTGDPGVIGMFVGSTVEMLGDHTADWSNKVVAQEAGTWDISLAGGYTIVKLVPEPATALFLLAGLPLLRRRRA